MKRANSVGIVAERDTLKRVLLESKDPEKIKVSDLLGTFIERNLVSKNLIIEFCPDDAKSFWIEAKALILQMRNKWDDPTLYAGLETLNREITNWQEKMQKQKRAHSVWKLIL